jgi:hypothetical protein
VRGDAAGGAEAEEINGGATDLGGAGRVFEVGLEGGDGGVGGVAASGLEALAAADRLLENSAALWRGGGPMLERLFGTSPSTPNSRYAPEIPQVVTNFGAAGWRVSVDAEGARVFAPRCPPWWALTMAISITAGVMTPVVIGFAVPNSMGGRGSTIAALIIVPIALGLAGVWSAVLAGNLIESSRGDVARLDRRTGVISLPRRGLEFAASDVLRIEVATFCLSGNSGQQWMRDVVLVRGPDGDEVFERLIRNPPVRSRIGEQIAAAFGVPFVRAYAGRYDWTTKARIDS